MPRASFTRSKSITNSNAQSNEKKPRIDQLVDVFKPKDGKWYEIRLTGPIFSYSSHWLDIYGKDNKEISFPKQCLAYNDETESVDSTLECPYCDLIGEHPLIHYYQNIIMRSLEDGKPAKNLLTKEEKDKGFKDKDSESWTPVRVIRLPAGAIATLKKLSELNKHGKKGEKIAYDVADDQYGCDIQYLFDNSKSGTSKHSFQKADHSPLDEIQLNYLLWNIENLIEPETLEEATTEIKRLKGKMVSKKGKSNEEEADDDDTPRNKKRKVVEEDDDDDVPVKSKKKAIVDDDDDDLPVKTQSKKKSRPVVVEEDEDDDTSISSKKKSRFDDESDETTEDDEIEEKPIKTKGAKKPKFDDDEQPETKQKYNKKKVEEESEESDDDDDIPF